MSKFKKRINIENATSFKLEYRDGNGEMKEKEFTSYKSMEQFHSRQDAFLYLDYHRYAFVNEKWHRFMKLRSPFVFQEELDFINKTFNEDVEDKIPQLSDLKKYNLKKKKQKYYGKLYSYVPI